MREQICFAIERIKSGSTQSPICLIPSLKSPANLNPSGKDPNRLNSGSENRRRSLKCIAPCMPRLPSLRRIVRAGFLGSNFTALKPWPVMWVSEVPTRILFQNLKDRYFPQPRKEPPAAPEAWSSRRAIPRPRPVCSPGRHDTELPPSSLLDMSTKPMNGFCLW